MWITLFFGGTAALFLIMTFTALYHLRWARRLPPLDALTAMPGLDGSNAVRVRCSVVIAARDEEARIEGTVRHLLAQRGVEIEVIVVDDRSRDRTGEILHRLAVEDSRVKPRRVDTLPEGWLGKCHACHLGASAATGDWILFTDADCWLKPDVIVRALRIAESERADHITLTPGVLPESLGAQAWHLAFLISVVDWLSAVNRDRPKAYFGIGAFNLVRAAAYRQCGGYEALRLTVLDDVKLGLLLRRSGKRTRGFLGADDVQCHWGTTVRGMIQVMEKNYFAAIDFRLEVVLAAALFGTLMLCGVVIGFLTGTAVGMGAGLAPFSVMLPAGILAKRLGWSLRSAAVTPFFLPVLCYAVVNSTWVTLRQGGIRWRDTFYPLDILRKGTLR